MWLTHYRCSSNHKTCTHKPPPSSLSHMHTCLNIQAARRIRQPVGHVLFWAISRQKLICHLPLEAWFWSSVSSIISSTHIHTAKAICPHYLYGKCFAWIDVFFSFYIIIVFRPIFALDWTLYVCVCVSVYVHVCVCFQSERGTIVLLDVDLSV